MKGTMMVGFDIDLINAIAKTLGIKVNEDNVTFDNILPGIASGRYAIGNSSFTDNAKRQKQVNFVDYFQAGEGVYAKASSMLKFKKLSSFCGLKVAVETGTVEQTDAAAVKCMGGKRVTVQSYSTQTEANVAVSSGQADVGFLDSQIAGYVVAQSSGAFKLLGSAVNVAPYGIATAKTVEGKKFAKAIQAALKVLIGNGTYLAILKKYGVQAGALKSSQIVLNGGH
jgi:polar amino acid transport system substrate-binding protein